MTPNPAEIERIVREVLAVLDRVAPDETGTSSSRLAADGTSISRLAADGTSISRLAADGTSAPAPGTPSGDVILQARVVTLAELDGRLATARRLVVPAGAVITPAARDELQRRNITIGFAAGGDGRGDRTLRLVTYIVDRRFEPAPLASALVKSGIVLAPQRSDCLIASTDALAAAVEEPDALGMLVTRHTAAGLCLANRHAGVRAIYACSPSGVAAGAEAVGANVLVANAATPFFELRQMVAAFCRGGVKPCPEVFREKLQ